MKAIKVTYKGPTNTKGSRLIVTDGDTRMTIPYDHSLNHNELYAYAAELFKLKMGWTGRLIQGSLKDGEVFVFAPEE